MCPPYYYINKELTAGQIEGSFSSCWSLALDSWREDGIWGLYEERVIRVRSHREREREREIDQDLPTHLFCFPLFGSCDIIIRDDHDNTCYLTISYTVMLKFCVMRPIHKSNISIYPQKIDLDTTHRQSFIFCHLTVHLSIEVLHVVGDIVLPELV